MMWEETSIHNFFFLGQKIDGDRLIFFYSFGGNEIGVLRTTVRVMMNYKSILFSSSSFFFLFLKHLLNS